MVCHLEAVSEGRAQAEMATITTMIRRAHSHPTGPPLAKDWMAAEPFAAFELLWSCRGAQLFMVLRGLSMRQKREFKRAVTQSRMLPSPDAAVLVLCAGLQDVGLDVTMEAYPYTAGMTNIASQLFMGVRAHPADSWIDRPVDC